MYRRAHCCNSVASVAHVRLITKLKNQSAFVQTAYNGGEKAGVEPRLGRRICDIRCVRLGVDKVSRDRLKDYLVDLV